MRSKVHRYKELPAIPFQILSLFINIVFLHCPKSSAFSKREGYGKPATKAQVPTLLADRDRLI
jgi:hypothetical protein